MTRSKIILCLPLIQVAAELPTCTEEDISKFLSNQEAGKKYKTSCRAAANLNDSSTITADSCIHVECKRFIEFTSFGVNECIDPTTDLPLSKDSDALVKECAQVYEAASGAMRWWSGQMMMMVAIGVALGHHV